MLPLIAYYPPGLTLFNKLVLQGFPFGWTLTAVHMFGGTLGTHAAQHLGYFKRSRLTSRENYVMLAFSVLYTVNIAVSNISLQMVTVPVSCMLSLWQICSIADLQSCQFHQVVRAMTPLFTIMLVVALYRKSPSLSVYASLVPVVFGVGLATFGEYDYSTWGLILTVIGTVLAAIKGIVTNREPCKDERPRWKKADTVRTQVCKLGGSSFTLSNF